MIRLIPACGDVDSCCVRPSETSVGRNVRRYNGISVPPSRADGGAHESGSASFGIIALMAFVALMTSGLLPLNGCSRMLWQATAETEKAPPPPHRIERKTEVAINPATLDGIRKITGDVSSGLQKMQQQRLDTVQQTIRDEHFRCWQRGERHC